MTRYIAAREIKGVMTYLTPRRAKKSIGRFRQRAGWSPNIDDARIFMHAGAAHRAVSDQFKSANATSPQSYAVLAVELRIKGQSC